MILCCRPIQRQSYSTESGLVSECVTFTFNVKHPLDIAGDDIILLCRKSEPGS